MDECNVRRDDEANRRDFSGSGELSKSGDFGGSGGGERRFRLSEEVEEIVLATAMRAGKEGVRA